MFCLVELGVFVITVVVIRRGSDLAILFYAVKCRFWQDHSDVYDAVNY